MRHWRLSRVSTGAKTEPNQAASCQRRDALGSRRPREHAGQESTGKRRSFQLRRLNERCLHRLDAGSRRLKGSVGPNSSDKSETLGMIAPPGCEHHVGSAQQQTNAVRRGNKGAPDSVKSWGACRTAPRPREAVFFGSVNSLPVVRTLVSDGRLVQGCSPFHILRSVPGGMRATAVCSLYGTCLLHATCCSA